MTLILFLPFQLCAFLALFSSLANTSLLLFCADHVSYDKKLKIIKVDVHEPIPPASERGFMLMGAL
jgi:hypothetical protein